MIVAVKEIVIDRVDVEDNDANVPYHNSHKDV
jgi:hypothetical protein